MTRPSSITLVLGVAAVAAVGLVHADPWHEVDTAAPLMSAQSMARRLFPGLSDADLSTASITVTHGAQQVRFVPGSDGQHQVWADDVQLGWADTEGIAGLWSSLRMATTLRAVAPGSDIGERRGEIQAKLGDGSTFSLQLHEKTGDGAGIYGILGHEGPAVWVVEPELGEVLQQPAQAWLLRRLLPNEPAETIAVTWAGVALARGADGLWRIESGAPQLLLSEQAVAMRLTQAFAADLEPMLPREAAATTGPFTTTHDVTDSGGGVRSFALGGPCPQRPDRIVVDRGPGLLGCIDPALVAAWPLTDPDAGMLEAQLVPHAYGRVLAVERVQAQGNRRLRRFGGGWVLEEAGAMVEVSEPEVFRWFAALQSVEVELPTELLPLAATGPASVRIELDSGQHLYIHCGQAPGLGPACARDEGPALRLRGELPPLELDRDQFADRRLIALQPGEVRSLELLPGPTSPDVRQSVRLDLGVWRLDAPVHPDGVAVLDEVRLEAILAAVQSLRASAWTDVPMVAPVRSLHLERTRGPTVSLDLYVLGDRPGCIAHLPEQAHAAHIEMSVCTTLQDDLLYNDPLRDWLGQARSIELRSLPDGPSATVQRNGDAFHVEAGDEALLSDLSGWQAFRSAGLRTGEPRGAGVRTAKIVRNGAPAVRIELGPDLDGAPAWVRIVGSPWYYLAGPPARE